MIKSLPHFLIIGAPKCGTTALHNYLSQHPEINMSPKEIHYFGKDLGYKVDRPTLEEYQSHFKNTGINGDGSVWYLYSDTIYQELKDLGISPKIIVLLRNPVEVAYSLHSQNLVDANENVTVFEEALSLEESRKNGKNLPPNVDPPRTLYYRETADFFPRMQVLFQHIPSENIFVGLQEHMQKDTAQFLKQVEHFLNLNNFNGYTFNLVNENRQIKNKKVHQLIKKPNSLNRMLFRTIIPFKKVRSWMVHGIYKKNVTTSKRPELSLQTKRVLQLYFKPSIQALNEIITPDISHWID